MKILVTGAAGFIGMHTAQRLLERGEAVVGADNLNDYYDPALKRARLALLEPYAAFTLEKCDVADRNAILALFERERPDRVIHLAAQAGVRHSLVNPRAYIESNITGFANVLDACRETKIEHLVYASSSSVYGGNKTLPFTEDQRVDHPLNLYAATKKSNELMAYAYSHLYGLPATGLRFFTVYGPWGRPDMALFLFTKAILEGQPVNVFNHGKMTRDFTYIDDIVEGIVRVFDRIPDNEPPHKIFNIGNGRPTQLLDYIRAIEAAVGKKAELNMLPHQPGDMDATAADTTQLEKWVGFRPDTPIKTGVDRFVNWYRGYYSGR